MLTHCVIPRVVVSEPCMTQLMEDIADEVVKKRIRHNGGLVNCRQYDGGRQHAVLAFKAYACVRACKFDVKAFDAIA